MSRVKHIVSFSGGKDSTCMLLKMIESGMQIDEIIFIDTGIEFKEMYEHINKVEQNINREIKRLKPDNNFEYYAYKHEVNITLNKWLKKRYGIDKKQLMNILRDCYDESSSNSIVEKQELQYKNEKPLQIGYGFPDNRNRWCTTIFKKKVIKEYLNKYKGCDVIEYHGIAFDEKKRANRNKEKKIQYPLIEWEITEEDALNYCYEKGYDWGGLYKFFNRVSCWCCPLKNLTELKNLFIYFPEKWDELKIMQSNVSNKFRKDYSIDELEIRFKKEIEQELRRIYMFLPQKWNDLTNDKKGLAKIDRIGHTSNSIQNYFIQEMNGIIVN